MVLVDLQPVLLAATGCYMQQMVDASGSRQISLTMCDEKYARLTRPNHRPLGDGFVAAKAERKHPAKDHDRSQLRLGRRASAASFS